MNAVVAEHQPRALVAQAQVTPDQLLRLAMDKGVDLDRLEKLYALQQQWQADQARMAFTEAMVEFKKNPPEIIKDKHVAFETSKGWTEYDHTTLGCLCDALISSLAAVGISHDWEPNTTDPARISVACILTHSSGHSKRVTMHGPPDNSGGKNAIQAMSSTVSYLERYTLFAATGVAPIDDDDGRAAGKRTDEKEIPTAPNGYENWKADMNAKVSDGYEAFKASWQKAEKSHRLYANTHDKAWREAIPEKAKAADTARPS